uniref:Putative secreted protein n=1 Tax=Amblyomma parvum TaxID=251391 RepID=A0A023G0K0_AMBPA
MKCTFVLALSCATFIGVSHAQDEEEAADMEGATKRLPDVVGNIIYVMGKLGEMVVPESNARKTMRDYLRRADTCFRRADGLEIKYMNKFVESIPKSMDCQKMTFFARNGKQRQNAVKCYLKKLAQFQKVNRMPMSQVKLLGNMVACLKESFLMRGQE